MNGLTREKIEKAAVYAAVYLLCYGWIPIGLTLRWLNGDRIAWERPAVFFLIVLVAMFAYHYGEDVGRKGVKP